MSTNISENKLKELDALLLELALTNFERFCQLTKVDKTQAFICLGRKRKKTYGQLAKDTGMSRSSVLKRARGCG